MIVNILRSEEYSRKAFREIIIFLQQSTGPIDIVTPDEPVSWQNEELSDLEWDDHDLLTKKEYPYKYMDCSFKLEEQTHVFHWQDLFNKISLLRKKHNVNKQELAIVITSHANENNWFSAGDPNGGRNYFVQSSFWNHYVDGPERFAIVYEVASIILQSQLFENYPDLAAYAHKKPRGCINDLCQDKTEIAVKLRTADLCPECMSLIKNLPVDIALVSQVLDILEKVRIKFLFRDRFAVTQRPSRILIKGWQLKIILPDSGDEELRLSPVQRAVYLLFLRHPEGILFKEMPDHFEECKQIYHRTYTGGSIVAINNTINRLVYNEDSTLSEVLSKIKYRLMNQLGSNLAERYIIQGERAETRKINIDRKMIIWDSTSTFSIKPKL
jgi:hypothetical protein